MIHLPSSSSSSLIAAPEVGLWPSTASTLASSTGRVHHQLRGPKLKATQNDGMIVVCMYVCSKVKWRLEKIKNLDNRYSGLSSDVTQCGRMPPPASSLQVSLRTLLNSYTNIQTAFQCTTRSFAHQCSSTQSWHQSYLPVSLLLTI